MDTAQIVKEKLTVEEAFELYGRTSLFEMVFWPNFMATGWRGELSLGGHSLKRILWLEMHVTKGSASILLHELLDMEKFGPVQVRKFTLVADPGKNRVVKGDAHNDHNPAIVKAVVIGGDVVKTYASFTVWEREYGRDAWRG